MKLQVSSLSLLLVLVCPGCGGDTRESLTAEGMATMKDLIATFETVKDQASAKAAKPRLTTLSQQLNRLQERQAKLPQPTEAETKALVSKHGKEMEELQRKLAGVMMRIQLDPGIQAELNDIDMKGLK